MFAADQAGPQAGRPPTCWEAPGIEPGPQSTRLVRPHVHPTRARRSRLILHVFELRRADGELGRERDRRALARRAAAEREVLVGYVRKAGIRAVQVAAVVDRAGEGAVRFYPAGREP